MSRTKMMSYFCHWRDWQDTASVLITKNFREILRRRCTLQLQLAFKHWQKKDNLRNNLIQTHTVSELTEQGN